MRSFMRRRWRRRWVIGCVVCVVVWGFVCMVGWLDERVTPALIAAARTHVHVRIAQAIREAMRDGVDVRSDVVKPDVGNSFVLDYAVERRIAREAQDVVARLLGREATWEQDVSVGQLLDIALLSSIDAAVQMKFRAIGIPAIEVRTRTETLGINVVVFHVYVHIEVVGTVFAPFAQASQTVTTDVPLQSIVIKGDVPQLFLPHTVPPNGR